MAATAPFVLSARDIPATAIARQPKPSLLRRFYGAIVEARQREADRQIARFLGGTGGRLTDSIEREIERRLSLDQGGWLF